MPLAHITTDNRTAPLDYAPGAPIPWWGKMLAKLVMARFPIGYRVWNRLGLFRHGETDRNLSRVLDGWDHLRGEYDRLSGRPLRSAIEIGPGDSVGRALCAAADGVERMWLIDAGDFATPDPAHYRAVAGALTAAGKTLPSLDGAVSRADILSRCGATYLTQGLASFAAIPDGSVDFIFSNVVLEHLPRAEFPRFMAEMVRVLRPGGIAYHSVDLHDHLGGALESLRFPMWFWEHPAVASSGFYTNRLGMGDIRRMAQQAGFDTAIPWVRRWPRLPTPRPALHRDFQGIPDDELLVCCFGIVMQKPGP